MVYRFTTVALILVLPRAAAAAESKKPQPAPQARPNVVLVMTDDQGYGDLGSHGNPVLKTPYMDKLREESVRLADFHVTPMCTPTRGQLMTGRDALANGAYCVCSGRPFVHPGIPTMAELLAAGGYRTGIFGKWHLGDNYPHRPNDRGFHEALYHLGWGITSTPDFWNNDYFDDFFRHNGRVERYEGYCTDVWFTEAARWIKACRQQGQPFFAYLAPNAPHGPFWVPKKYREPYASLDRDTAGFFGMIANLDENLAKLDAVLAETGLRDNTIFIFMTDNGGTGGIRVWNAGLRGAKTSLYEGGHRVPCFVRWPAGGLRSPGDVAALTECQDLLPTLLDLCGVKVRPGVRFDGVSLARALRGHEQPELAERMLVVQYGGLVQSEPAKHDAAVLWNQWRLVAGKELYDVKADPGQKTDLAARHPASVQKMRAHYERWWAGTQPALAQSEAITIGADQENPTTLSAMDWYVPKLSAAAQTVDIRRVGREEVQEGALPLGRPMPAMNGPWNVQVASDGHYQIALRRWPREADAAITAGLPALKGVDGPFPEGIALPIVKARLKIGTFDQTQEVRPDDRAVVFSMPLLAGRTQLQTWFYDAEGKELCGAFFVDVLRGPALVRSAEELPPPRLPEPFTVVDLNLGESVQAKLPDGRPVSVTLIDLVETRDDVRDAVRRAEVTVEVNRERVKLVSANYRLPVAAGGVQIDCPITKGYILAIRKPYENPWSLDKDVRLRLWPGGGPWIQPGTFVYPARQRWFATDTQMCNEPVFVDGGDLPTNKAIYYHWGLDIGGAEGLVEVVAATDGFVITAGLESLARGELPGPVRPRYDVVYVRDARGWFHRYSHLFTIDPAVKPGAAVKMGQRIGLLGKEGSSGGWAHLHYDMSAVQPSGRYGIVEGYCFLWQAYHAQHHTQLQAVARPHYFVKVGQPVTLDGTRSWSVKGSRHIKGYEWTFTDGSRAAGPTSQRTYDRPGVYSEILKVTDLDGRIDYDFAVVHVINPQRLDQVPPSIHAAYWPTFGLKPGQEITFKVRSFRLRADEGRERWDFGDGSPPVEVQSDGRAVKLAKDGYAVTTHRYQRPGHYLVSVQRTNDRGETATARLHVRVGEE